MADSSQDSNVDPVIILGTGRSGTSILTRVIGLHDQIWSFRWESQLLSGLPGLVDLADSYSRREASRYRKRVLEYLYRRDVRGAYEAGLFEIIEFDELENLLDELLSRLRSRRGTADRRAACREFCNGVFVPPALSDGAVYWCEKTPRNLLFADQISRILPTAKFIHVVRDARYVAASIMRRRFWPVASSRRYPPTRQFTGDQSFGKVKHYWATLLDIAAEHEQEIGCHRWLNVKLEDLIDQTAQELSRITDFLGLECETAFTMDVEKQLRPSVADLTDVLSTVQQAEVTELSRSNLERFGYL